jgi:Tol biopolymer transport system component
MKYAYFIIIIITLLSLVSSCTTSVEDPITKLPPSENFDAHNGTWNTDGTKVLFQHTDLSSSLPQQQQLWIYNSDTDDRYKVFDGPSLNPDWSPSGEWIAFHSNSIPERIFKYSIDADSLVQITGEQTAADFRNTSIARWSPDGGQMLFTIIAGDPRGAVVMNSDGSDAEIVVPFAVGANWFPDGERIVYVNWDTDLPANQQRQLYMAEVDGSNPEKLTDLENSDYVSSPVVSPDGTKVAFLHRPGRSTDVYILNLQDNSIERLTTLNNQGVAREPRWHPDGDKIMFSVRDINVSRRLYTIQPSSGEIEAVFPAP